MTVIYAVVTEVVTIQKTNIYSEELKTILQITRIDCFNQIIKSNNKLSDKIKLMFFIYIDKN